MDRYEEYYSKKQVSELLEQLMHHKMEMHPLDKQWYEGLIAFLGSLHLEGKAGALYGQLLSSDITQLNFMKDSLRKSIEELRTEEELNNPFVIDPTLIADAGRKMKMMAFILIAAILVVVIFGAVASYPGSMDFGTRSGILGLLGFLGVVLHVILLSMLFSAGNSLEKSVRRSQKK